MQSDRSPERGVALVVTLVVVALLTVLVMEFTYSVQVESRIARNSLNALQATYLARSGINILAGALLVDNSPDVDPDETDRQEGWGSFLIEDGCSPLPALELPPNWQLCVRIVDEAGKINVNLTRPRQTNPNLPPPSECANANEVCWIDALVRLLESHGVDPEALRAKITNYWVENAPEPAPGRPPQLYAPEFLAIEDVAAVPAFSELRAPAVFHLLRQFVTALPLPRQEQAGVNINTAPREVLKAIINDAAAVDEILARREQGPFNNPSAAFFGLNVPIGLQQLFNRSSRYYRLEASAVVNGVGKTIRALVRRDGPRRQSGQSGLAWSLAFLEWEKQGGAELIEQH